MTPDDKDFVDRAILAAEKLTDEKFNSRDVAITLLRTEKKDSTATYLALVAILLGLATLLLTLKGHP